MKHLEREGFTEDNVYMIYNRLTDKGEKGMVGALYIFLDCIKAFKFVPYEKLIRKNKIATRDKR